MERVAQQVFVADLSAQSNRFEQGVSRTVCSTGESLTHAEVVELNREERLRPFTSCSRHDLVLPGESSGVVASVREGDGDIAKDPLQRGVVAGTVECLHGFVEQAQRFFETAAKKRAKAKPF